MTSARPSDRDTISALRTVGRALGLDAAYWRDGAFWYVLSDSWALRLSPDSAGRFRLGACYGRTEVATLWALPGDLRRLALMARDLQAEVEALAR
jgi:hypothetical protein